MLLFPGWNRNRSFLFDINVGFASRKIAFDEIEKPVSSNAEFFDNDSPELFSQKENDHTKFRQKFGIPIGYTFL